MTLFETITKSVTAADIADTVAHVEITTSIEELQEFSFQAQVPFIIIENGNTQLGYVGTLQGGCLELESDSADLEDHIELILPSMMVPGNLPVVDLVEIMKSQYFVFCMDKNRITGSVSWNCFDKLIFKYCLFGIALEVENLFSSAIMGRRYNESEFFSKLSQERKAFVQGKMIEAYNSTSPPINLLSFKDKMFIMLRDQSLSELLPFAGKNQARSFIEKICKLRNIIAHGGSIIGMINPHQEFCGFVSEMNLLAKHLKEHIDTSSMNIDSL